VHFRFIGRPFVKRFVLSYRTVVSLSILSVCNVGVLWRNGWMDQDETWHGGMPRLWPHCVSWGPSSPENGHCPPFSAHVSCGQTAGCIKMPLGTEVGLGRGNIVLHGDSTPPQKKGAQQPPLSALYCGQAAGWIKMPLGREVNLGPSHIVLDGDAALPQKGQGSPQFSACLLWPYGCMDVDATW